MRTLPLSLLFGLWFVCCTVTAQDPVPVAITPTQVAYKVIDLQQLRVAKNETPAVTLEIVLNELALAGWKVVASSGSLVILER